MGTTGKKKTRKEKFLQWFLFPTIVGVVVGVVVYFFIVSWFEKPHLKVEQYFCVANYLVDDELYFCSYIDATNNGKQPIGLQKATLEVITNNKIHKNLGFLPVFPRYYISDEARAPSMDNPFFYTATFYENTVKDKKGKSKNYDYHPKELIPKDAVLRPGDYEEGYLFFKLKDISRESREIYSIKGRVIFETTHGVKHTKWKEFKKWSKEKFGERFFIIGEIKR